MISLPSANFSVLPAVLQEGTLSPNPQDTKPKESLFSRVFKVFWNVLSIFIFPIGIYRLLRWCLHKEVSPTTPSYEQKPVFELEARQEILKTRASELYLKMHSSFSPSKQTAQKHPTSVSIDIKLDSCISNMQASHSFPAHSTIFINPLWLFNSFDIIDEFPNLDHLTDGDLDRLIQVLQSKSNLGFFNFKLLLEKKEEVRFYLSLWKNPELFNQARDYFLAREVASFYFQAHPNESLEIKNTFSLSTLRNIAGGLAFFLYAENVWPLSRLSFSLIKPLLVGASISFLFSHKKEQETIGKLALKTTKAYDGARYYYKQKEEALEHPSQPPSYLGQIRNGYEKMKHFYVIKWCFPATERVDYLKQAHLMA